MLSLAIYPLLGLAFFPKTDAGQFTINLKVPTGTRIEVTDQYVAKVEDLIRHTVEPADLRRTLGRTGEVANKIGTYTKAVLARRHGIPFYVAIPLSTIDWNLKSGLDIPIEERHESEVLGAWGVTANPKSIIRKPKSAKRAYVRVANPTSGALNPGFDVTPPELITGIITPMGIFKPRELWSQRRELGCPQVGANRGEIKLACARKTWFSFGSADGGVAKW